MCKDSSIQISIDVVIGGLENSYRYITIDITKI